MQRKVSADGVNLLDLSRCRVDAVNKDACASAYWRSSERHSTKKARRRSVSVEATGRSSSVNLPRVEICPARSSAVNPASSAEASARSRALL